MSFTLVQAGFAGTSGPVNGGTPVSLPAPPTAGNVLLLITGYRGETYIDKTPGGWTLLVGNDFSAEESYGHAVLAKVADGTEQTVMITDVDEPESTIYSEWSGFGGVLPTVDEYAVADQTDNDIFYLPAVEPTDGTAVLLIASTWKAFAAPNPGPVTLSGYTLIDDTGYINVGNRHRLTAWYQDVASASGTYGPIASSSTGSGFDDWNVIHVALKASTGAPPVPPGIHLSIDTVELTNAVEKMIRVEYNAPGYGYFRIRRDDPLATEANLARGNIVSVTIGEIDLERAIFEFILEDGDFELISSEEQGGELLAFGGRGTLAMLARAPILDESNVVGSGWVHADAGVWRFEDEATGYILRQIVQEAENMSPTPLPGLDVHFGAVNDSDASPWPTYDGRYEIPIGSDALTETLRLVEQGHIRVRMDPGLIFRAYQVLGGDKTGAFGPGVVRFEKGVNIASELTRQQHGGVFNSHVLVRYAGGYVQVAAASYPYVHWGFLDLSNVSDSGMATEAGQSLLGLHDDAQDAIQLTALLPHRRDGIDEAAGLYYPGQAFTDNGCYWPGDIVTVHSGTADFDYNESEQRVYAITMTETEVGHLAEPILELNAPLRTGDESFDNTPGSVIEGTAGGSSGGGSTGPHTHPQYQGTWEKDVAGGYAGLNGSGVVAEGEVGTGTPTDGYVLTATGTGSAAWETPAAAGSFVTTNEGGGEDVSTVAASGSTETIDLTDGNVHDITLTADCTFTFAAVAAGAARSFTLVLRQDGTGGWDPTWPGSVVWAGGSAPTLDTTASSVSVLTFFTLDGGTVWYGFSTGGGGTPATTVESETTFGISAAVGTDTEYARQDHTHGTPADPVTEAAVRDIGHWELVMEVGVTAPPVPVTNEAEDDWLYAWVSG